MKTEKTAWQKEMENFQKGSEVFDKLCGTGEGRKEMLAHRIGELFIMFSIVGHGQVLRPQHMEAYWKEFLEVITNRVADRVVRIHSLNQEEWDRGIVGELLDPNLKPYDEEEDKEDDNE